jgi:hypothetical protein
MEFNALGNTQRKFFCSRKLVTCISRIVFIIKNRKRNIQWRLVSFNFSFKKTELTDCTFLIEKWSTFIIKINKWSNSMVNTTI